MADTDKTNDSYASALSAYLDYNEALSKANEAIKNFNFPPVFTNSYELGNLSTYLQNPTDEVTQELLKNRSAWCDSITSISANLTSLFDERIQFWTNDFSGEWDEILKNLKAIDVAPVTESAEKATEALTGEPDKPYTEKEAEAALPKLVNFANRYDEVTEAIVTVTVKTKSGGQAMMSAKLTREQIMSGMDLDKVLVNDEPTMIALPKSLNQSYHAQLALVDQGRTDAALPPPAPAEDLVALGPHARQFIEKADRLTHTIHFKNGDRLEMLPGRDIAWQIVEFLLQNGEIQNGGWVTLPPELQEKKWTSQFLVSVKPLRGGSSMADPRHDMTKVRHHIESDAKKGRRPENAHPPKLRFCRHIIHETYDPVDEAYKVAVKEQKRRDAQSNN